MRSVKLTLHADVPDETSDSQLAEVLERYFQRVLHAEGGTLEGFTIEPVPQDQEEELLDSDEEQLDCLTAEESERASKVQARNDFIIGLRETTLDRIEQSERILAYDRENPL
jgi:hypothetical protein